MKKITDTLQISRSNQYARGIEKKRDINHIPMIENIFPLSNRLSMRGLRMGIDV